MVNSDSCTANFVQRAGIAALRGHAGARDAMVEEFRRRRDLIVDGLNSMPGVTARGPRRLLRLPEHDVARALARRSSRSAS